MTTSAGTGPSEVRVEIDTELSDSDINDILDRVERDINRTYSSGASDFSDTQHRIDFEAAVAAFRVATGRDPVAGSIKLSDLDVDYAADLVDGLRRRVQALDPFNSFPVAGHRVDSARHTATSA